MTTANGTGYLSLPTAAAINEGERVHINASGQFALSGATDPSVGTATHNAASGGTLTVKLWTAPGTFLVVASAAITAGARLFPTASGRVDDAGTTPLNLIAKEAATAAGNIIEAAPCMVGA
jgi:hypothetical protein